MADDKESRDDETLDIIGASGLKQYDGRVYEEFLPDLLGDKAVRMYKEMSMNEPVITGILYAIRTLVRQTRWEIREAADTPEAKAAADFVGECLFEDMEHTFSDTLSEILSFLTFGYSVNEITYKIRRGPTEEDKRFKSKFTDNRIGWRGFPIRAQESIHKWDIDDHDGSILGVYQQPPPSYSLRYIPREKFLLFRADAHKNNPEGRSILRGAFISYYYKKKIMTYEGIGISRDLAGLPVMEVPLQILSSSASSGEKAVLAAMKSMIQKVGRDEYEGLVVPAEQLADGTPSGYRLKLLSAGGRRPIDVNEIIKRYESRIAMSMLGEFILLGSESVGSFALADSKTSLFAQALGTYLDSIASELNNQAIPKLMRLNGFEEHNFPSLAYDDIETPELAELTGALSGLVGAGVLTPDDKLEDFVRDYANLPLVDSMSARVDPEAGVPPDDFGPYAEPETTEEPSADSAEDEAGIETAAPDVPVSAVTLNGAQVSSLLSIIEQVSGGTLPRETAVQLIVTSFNVTEQKADELLGPVGRGFVPGAVTQAYGGNKNEDL